jgi:hypothetical protein
MDLWSKGLGRLVLTIRLEERKEVRTDDAKLVMDGTMGKPTYWDWSVDLDETDVVDFLVFLKRPAPVRFMVESDRRWAMLWSALQGAVIFALRTVRYLLLGAPRDAESPQTAGLPVEEKR